MRISRNWVAGGLVSLAIGAVAALAIAETAEVTARQDAMKSMGGAMKTIKGIVEAGGPAGDIVAPANKIAEVAGQIPNLWPQGSDTEDDGSKPEIWTMWEKFLGNANDLKAQAEMLASAAGGGDMATIGAQFEKVGGACGQCHQDFRIKK